MRCVPGAATLASTSVQSSVAICLPSSPLNGDPTNQRATSASVSCPHMLRSQAFGGVLYAYSSFVTATGSIITVSFDESLVAYSVHQVRAQVAGTHPCGSRARIHVVHGRVSEWGRVRRCSQHFAPRAVLHSDPQLGRIVHLRFHLRSWHLPLPNQLLRHTCAGRQLCQIPHIQLPGPLSEPAAVQLRERREHVPAAPHPLISQVRGGVLYAEATGSIDINFAQSTVTGNYASVNGADVRAQVVHPGTPACVGRVRHGERLRPVPGVA